MATVPLDKRDPERYYAVLARLSEGASIREVRREFRMDYYTIKKYFPNAGRPDLQGGFSLRDSDPERMAALTAAVNAGLSYNEIQRTLGVDYRTTKRHFPEYKPFPVGGGGDAAIIRETNRQLAEFLRRGKIGKHRDSGMNLKGDV